MRGSFPRGENETGPAELTMMLSENVDVDYISESPISLECRLSQFFSLLKQEIWQLVKLSGYMHEKE